MSPRSGVTWLEVLVVVSVIALLLALGLPAMQNARESSGRVECQNHLKELGIAAHHYESVHRHFPGMFYHFRSLLPYLDQEPLYKHLVGWERPGRYRYAGSVPVLVCPSDSHANVARNPTSYRLNLGTTLDSKLFDGMLEGRNKWQTGHRTTQPADGCGAEKRCCCNARFLPNGSILACLEVPDCVTIVAADGASTSIADG